MFKTGSTLIKQYFPDFREPKDIDYVSLNPLESGKYSETYQTNHGKVELHYLPVSPQREMAVDELYTLKVSHAIYDIQWRKHMSDIRFLQLKGCKVDTVFLKDLRDFWLTIHVDNKFKRTNFDLPLDKFFNDKVVREIAHDELHLKFNPQPSYKLIINEGAAKPIQEKFNQLSDEQKAKVILEEAFVIGYERFKDKHYLEAYLNAQQTLVTRLHPVWLADYVILNWQNFYSAPYNFYKHV